MTPKTMRKSVSLKKTIELTNLEFLSQNNSAKEMKLLKKARDTNTAIMKSIINDLILKKCQKDRLCLLIVMIMKTILKSKLQK